MTAVGQVKRAVAAAIKAAGCAAIESYSEEQLKRYATAVAAVGTKETVIEESGAAQYLGEKVDEATQETVSVYGRKMLLTLLIEVYAPRTLGAAGCEKSGGGGDAGTDDGAAGGAEARIAPVGQDRLGQDDGHVPAGREREICGVLCRGGGRG